MKLGNAFSKFVATPIARGLGLGCIDPVTRQLRPESPCAQRRDSLNRFGDRLYDIFFDKQRASMPDAPTTKEFIVTKVRTTTEHFAVTAESVDAAEQAVRGSSGGTLISRNSSENYSVGPRPPEGSAQPVTPGRAQVLRSASGPVVRGGPSNAPGRGPSSLGGLV